MAFVISARGGEDIIAMVGGKQDAPHPAARVHQSADPGVGGLREFG